MLTPAQRKLNLTAHVTCSVSWMGALAGFLALSIAGILSREAEVVRGAYVSMNLVGTFVIVPLSLAAIATGLVQSLGTPWGLLRHYWVVTKLALTIFATVGLLLHQFTAVVEAARRASLPAVGALPDIGRVGVQLVADAAIGIVILLVVTTLSIYKPWGKTPYGRRVLQSTAKVEADAPLGFKIFLGFIAVIVIAFVITHLAGKGFHH